MVGPISFCRGVCDDHKSVTFVFMEIRVKKRIIVFYFEYKLLYLTLEKVPQRVCISLYSG